MSAIIRVLVKGKGEIPEEHFIPGMPLDFPFFNPDMEEYLGKVVDVERERRGAYSYFLTEKDGNKWLFHERWVVPVGKGVWYNNRGVCPVPEGTIIDVKYRSGKIRGGVRAGVPLHKEVSPLAVRWEHTGSPYDIMQWRYPPGESGNCPGVISGDQNLGAEETVMKETSFGHVISLKEEAERKIRNVLAELDDELPREVSIDEVDISMIDCSTADHMNDFIVEDVSIRLRIK